jgi:two-component system, chemotaxis family, response regulator Rcp1
VSARPIHVLLVEDSPGDVRLTREAMRQAKVHNELHVARDGEDAMAFLRREGAHAQAPTPDLVLLDLNLPRKDGREVLAEMKDDEDLRRIPVIVMTTSAAEADVVASYDCHANAFITKPVDFERFIEVVRSIESFWLSVVHLPPA